MVKKKTSLSKTDNTLKLDLLADSLGYHLRRTQIKNYRQFSKIIGKTRTTPTQLAVMVLVEANPGMSQADLGKVLEMDRATTMTIIDKLQNRSWLARHKSTVDGRKHALHMTPRGSSILKELKSEAVNLERRFASVLTEKERGQLLNLLQKLL